MIRMRPFLFLLLLMLAHCSEKPPAITISSAMLADSAFSAFPSDWIFSTLYTQLEPQAEITYTKTFSTGYPHFHSASVDLSQYANSQKSLDIYERFKGTVFAGIYDSEMFVPAELTVEVKNTERYEFGCIVIWGQLSEQQSFTQCTYRGQYERCIIVFSATITPDAGMTFNIFEQIVEQNIDVIPADEHCV